MFTIYKKQTNQKLAYSLAKGLGERCMKIGHCVGKRYSYAAFYDAEVLQGGSGEMASPFQKWVL